MTEWIERDRIIMTVLSPEGNCKMVKHFLAFLLGIISLAVCGKASAQGYGQAPVSRSPVVSPYLNLLGNGVGGRNNAVINYFGIVRPELEFRSFATQQRRSLSALERQLQDYQDRSKSLPQTGHPATFLNLSHYYRR